MGGVFHYSLPDDSVSHQALDTFISNVCDATGILKAEVLGHGRRREVVDLRHFLMTVAYHEFGLTVKTVGNLFGRDHSSVTHAKTKIEDIITVGALQKDPHLRLCVSVSEQEFINQFGHTFHEISKWLTPRK